jgi:hypothetical protein
MVMDNPIGALVTFEWVGTDPAVRETAYFSFGEYDEERETDSFGVPDDRIFYYVIGAEAGLKGMMADTNPFEFKIVSYELTYPVTLHDTVEGEWNEERVDIIGQNGNVGYE